MKQWEYSFYIKNYRKLKNIGQDEIAYEIGTNRTRISEIEKAKSNVSDLWPNFLEYINKSPKNVELVYTTSAKILNSELQSFDIFANNTFTEKSDLISEFDVNSVLLLLITTKEINKTLVKDYMKILDEYADYFDELQKIVYDVIHAIYSNSTSDAISYCQRALLSCSNINIRFRIHLLIADLESINGQLFKAYDDYKLSEHCAIEILNLQLECVAKLHEMILFSNSMHLTDTIVLGEKLLNNEALLTKRSKELCVHHLIKAYTLLDRYDDTIRIYKHHYDTINSETDFLIAYSLLKNNKIDEYKTIISRNHNSYFNAMDNLAMHHDNVLKAFDKLVQDVRDKNHAKKIILIKCFLDNYDKTHSYECSIYQKLLNLLIHTYS